MASSNIKDSVLNVLPTLSSDAVDKVVETLIETGVETSDDLSLVEDEDLRSTLKPIQIRRLISAWKHQSGESVFSPLDQNTS